MTKKKIKNAFISFQNVFVQLDLGARSIEGIKLPSFIHPIQTLRSFRKKLEKAARAVWVKKSDRNFKKKLNPFNKN